MSKLWLRIIDDLFCPVVRSLFYHCLSPSSHNDIGRERMAARGADNCIRYKKRNPLIGREHKETRRCLLSCSSSLIKTKRLYVCFVFIPNHYVLSLIVNVLQVLICISVFVPFMFLSFTI